MSLKHYLFILILMLMRVVVAYSQEIRTEICMDFRASSDVIDPSYSDNAARIKETIDFLKSIQEDKTVNLIEVSFCGAALPETVLAEDVLVPEVKGWRSKMHIKTNIIGLGMGIANIAAEIDLAPHWSIAVPFYYSGGFDYFKPTVKFRCIVVQPEARFYVKGNDGFYLGAHLGLGWYNFALDGEFRIQDYKGRTPAYGGGLGLGYALNFKKNPRWGMEFSIGGGAYKTKYDMFYNEINGPYAKHGVEGWYYGVDNASISFTYSFNLKREGCR